MVCRPRLHRIPRQHQGYSSFCNLQECVRNSQRSDRVGIVLLVPGRGSAAAVPDLGSRGKDEKLCRHRIALAGRLLESANPEQYRAKFAYKRRLRKRIIEFADQIDTNEKILQQVGPAVAALLTAATEFKGV